MKKRRHQLVALVWIILGLLAVLAGAFELRAIGSGDLGAAKATYGFIAIDVGIIVCALAILRHRRWGRIMLSIMLGIVASYCVVFVMFVGASFGTSWLMVVLAVGGVAVASIFALRPFRVETIQRPA
jgi:hypothetical protein